MSLNIYTSLNNIPKGMEFVKDPDSYIVSCGLPDNEYVRFVIENLEKGRYNNDLSFIDRFGYKLSYMDISTSSKILICVDTFKDKVINGIELGDNTGNELFKVKKGNILLTRRKIGVSIPNSSIDVVLDGKRFVSSCELREYIGRYL